MAPVLKLWEVRKSYSYYYDRKSRAACAQSFVPWQQATIEIMLTISLTIACSCPHMMVLFFTHIPFVVNYTINATPPESLQKHPLLFTTNHTGRTFFVWRLNSVRHSHPGHSIILLRSEIPSGMCAKLHTVAASNNRYHARNLSYYCLLALHIWWCYSSRTSCSWWIIQSTQHHRRVCNTTFLFGIIGYGIGKLELFYWHRNKQYSFTSTGHTCHIWQITE